MRTIWLVLLAAFVLGACGTDGDNNDKDVTVVEDTTPEAVENCRPPYCFSDGRMDRLTGGTSGRVP